MRYIKTPAAPQSVELSRIILGSTHFGTKIPDDEVFRIIDRFADFGGTAIDTARVYGDWQNTGNAASERVVGQWLKNSGKRNRFTLITKGAHYRLATPFTSRVKPECIIEDIELSLKNLGFPIDLYLLHRDDPTVPVEEIMPVLDRYVKAGDIRAIGASNWTHERIDEANNFAGENGFARFVASEIQWSLAHIDSEALPKMLGVGVKGVNAGECEKYMNSDIPLLAFTSITWGYFSKLLNGQQSLHHEELSTPENLRRAEIVRKWSEKTGASATAISVAYIASHPQINAAACVGASNGEQVADFMAAADLVLPQEFFDEIES